MERWLGTGGMDIIGQLGASFDEYGVTRERDQGRELELGWVRGTWNPTGLACNPHGIVQAGVHGVMLDAAMNFAVNACLEGRDRTKATLEMKVETMRPVRLGDQLGFQGRVIRVTRQVAFVQAQIDLTDGNISSRSTGTFLLHREPS